MSDPIGPEVGRVSVRVLPRTGDFKKALRKFLTKAEKDFVVNLPTGLNEKGAEKDFQKLRRSFERRKDGIEINTKLDSKRVKAELKALQRQKPEVKVDVVLKTRELVASLAKISGLQIAIGAGTGLAATLASSLVTATQTVATLVAGLAQVAAGLAALGPAAVGAAGVIGGTLALALVGVEKSTTKAVKQIRSAIHDLTPAFNGLRKTLRNNLLAGFGEELRKVGAKYIPVLRRGLGGIAKDINGMALEFSGFMREAGTVRDFGYFVGNTRKLLKGMEGTLYSIGSIFNDLAVTGSEFFEPFGERVAKATKQWATFINEARQSGELEKYMRDALIAGGALVDTFKNVGGIISGVFRAMQAGGEITLGTIQRLTGNLNEFINSARGQNALTQFFSGLRDIADSFAPALREAAVAVGDLAPIVGKMTKVLGPGLTVAIRELGDGLKNLGPGLLSFAGQLSKGLSNISKGFEPAGRALSRLLDALGPLLPLLGAVGAAIGKMMDASSAVFGPILKDITETLADTLQPILPALTKGFQELTKALGPVADDLKEFLAGALEQLGPQLPGLVESIFGLVASLAELAGAISPILPFFAGFGSLLGLIVQGISLLADGLSWFVDKITEFVNWAGPGIVDAVMGIADAFESPADIAPKVAHIVAGAFAVMNTAARDKFLSIKNGVSSAWASIQVKTTQVFGAVGRFTKSAWEGIKSTLVKAWADMVTRIIQAIDKVISLVRSLPEKAKNALSGIGSKLVKSGESLIQGFIQGIRNKIGELRSTVNSAMNVARQFFPYSPAKKGPFSGRGWVLYAGRSVSSAFAKGIKDKQDLVAKAAKNMSQAAKDAYLGDIKRQAKNLDILANRNDNYAKKIDNATKALKDAKKKRDDLARSLKRDAIDFAGIVGISTAAGTDGIATVLRNRLKAIKEFAKNLKKLRNAGLNAETYRQIVEAGPEQAASMARVLAEGGKSAVKEINEIQKQINSTAKGLGDASAKRLEQAGVDAAKGLLKGLKSQEKQLVDMMKRLAKTLANTIRKALKIHSPSRVMMEIGGYVSEGLAVGMGRKESLVSTASNRLASLAAAGPSVAGVGGAATAGASTAAAAGHVFNFNANSVDVTEAHVVPLINSALMRARIGRVI